MCGAIQLQKWSVSTPRSCSLLVPVISYFVHIHLLEMAQMHWNDVTGQGVSRCILLPKCKNSEAASSEKPNESAVIIYWLTPHYSRAFLLPKFWLETIRRCGREHPFQTSLERLRLECWCIFSTNSAKTGRLSSENSCGFIDSASGVVLSPCFVFACVVLRSLGCYAMKKVLKII